MLWRGKCYRKMELIIILIRISCVLRLPSGILAMQNIGKICKMGKVYNSMPHMLNTFDLIKQRGFIWIDLQ